MNIGDFYENMKLLIYNLLLLLIGVISPILYKYIELYIPSFLLIKQKEISSLLNTIFQVQATLATLSLPIISLMLIFFNQGVYGVEILGFTFIQKNKYKLNLNEKAISLLIFVLIEYYFVATNNIQGTLIILLVTIFEIISILHFTLEILSSTQKLSRNIRNNVAEILTSGIKNNHNQFNKISNQLYSDTRKRILDNDIILQENLDLYIDILFINSDYNKKNFIKIQNEINDIVNLMITNNLFEESVLFTKNLYQNLINQDSKLPLVLDKGYISIMEYLKNAPDSLMLYRTPVRTTLRNLFEFLLFFAVDRRLGMLNAIFPTKKSDDFIYFMNNKNIKEKYQKYKLFMKSDENFDDFRENLFNLVENK